LKNNARVIVQEPLSRLHIVDYGTSSNR